METNIIKVTATLLYVDDEIISFWLFKKEPESFSVEYFDSLESMLCAWIKYHFSGVMADIEAWDGDFDKIL